jgi:hypothetical protein
MLTASLLGIIPSLMGYWPLLPLMILMTLFLFIFCGITACPE